MPCTVGVYGWKSISMISKKYIYRISEPASIKTLSYWDIEPSMQ